MQSDPVGLSALGHNTLGICRPRQATSNLTNRDPGGHRLLGSSWHRNSSNASQRRRCVWCHSHFQFSTDWTDFACSLCHLPVGKSTKCQVVACQGWHQAAIQEKESWLVRQASGFLDSHEMKQSIHVKATSPWHFLLHRKQINTYLLQKSWEEVRTLRAIMIQLHRLDRPILP